MPDSAGDKLTGKFLIAKSDPEMDNTKPNLAAMLAMAGDFDAAFQDRIPSAVKETFKNRLPRDAGVQKLAFRLTPNETDLLRLIPDCLPPKEPVRTDIRGPVTDLWDRPVEFPQFEGRKILKVFSPLSGKKLPVSWVMLVVVGLLCWEWLTRKLLRLA